jgi:hypothetical protein
MRRLLPILALCLAPALLQAAMEVPVDLQVAIFKKVLKFDATLADAEHAAIVVVHAGDARAAGVMADAFKGAGFKATISEAGAALGAAKVSYFCPGSEAAAARMPAGVLTLGCGAAPVEQNKVAVGVGMVDGKPKLMVSLAAYNASGHAIDTQVLGLARIYR